MKVLNLQCTHGHGFEGWFASEDAFQDQLQRGLVAGERQLDEGEFLELFEATPQELADWCRDGKITDAKTLTGMLWLQNVLSGAWALDWRG